MIFQQTIKNPVFIRGVGLHSGKDTLMKIRPARANHGIVFTRTDLPGFPKIPASHKNIINTQLATTLGSGKAVVSTVEHLLAAFYGLGIDNVLIEVDGPEVPILDGSSAPYVEELQRAGLVTQPQLRPILALRKKVEVKVGEKWGFAEPSSRLEVHGSIEWDHPAIGYQEYHYIEGKTSFNELASARTFCLLKDVEMMQSRGLIKGGSLENAVVLDHYSVLNPSGLRFPNELVRHKVLDALGDFKLSGISFQGYFRLHRAGHDLHSQLLNAIFSNPDHFEIIGVQEDEAAPVGVTAGFAGQLVASVG